MKDNKTFQKHRNYFKRGDTLKITAIAVMAVSLILFFFGWSWISYIQFFVALPAGVALLVIHFTTTAGEDDLVHYIENATKEVSPDLLKTKEIQKKLLPSPAPVCEGGYEYREGVLVRRNKKGILLSSLYTKALLYPLDDAFCIKALTVSLFSEETTSLRLQIPYAEIRSVALVRETQSLLMGKKSVSATADRLVIEYGEGEAIKLPMRDSVDTDAWIEKVRELAEKIK